MRYVAEKWLVCPECMTKNKDALFIICRECGSKYVQIDYLTINDISKYMEDLKCTNKGFLKYN